MRKSFEIVFVIALVAMFFVSQSALAKTTLRFWTEWTDDPYYSTCEKLIQKFMDENPDVMIKHRPIENEQFHTVVRTGFTGGDPPEIVYLEGYEYVIRYAKTGQLLEINDWISTHEDRFVTGASASGKWKGNYYGAPMQVSNVSQIFYNVDILNEYGISPPETWREFLVSSQKLKDRGVIPISLGNKFGWCGIEWWLDIVTRFVGVPRLWDVITRKPGTHWTDPDFLQAAKLYEELSDWEFFSEGAAGMDFPAQLSLFLAGKTGYMHGQSGVVGQFAAMAPPDFKPNVMKVPQMLGAKGPKDGALYGTVLVLSKSLKDKELGLKFLDFMTGVENARIWVKDTQNIMATRGSVTAELAGPLLQKIASIIEGYEDAIPWVGHVSPAPLGHGGPMYVGATGILTGQYTAQSWMEWLETEAQKYEPIYTERL